MLVLASYAFRLPALLNARATNSDAAVVGLQAMHVLRGELAPFLWGSGYQTSADALWAAAFFLALGPSPLALMLSSLTLHVIATLLVFAALRRRFSPWTSLVVAAPLVVAPASIHTYALYPPRQLGLTLAVASLWALGGARGAPAAEGGRPARRRPLLMLALGGALYGLAVSADPYPMVLAPVVAAYAALVIADGTRLAERAARSAERKSGGVGGRSPLTTRTARGVGEERIKAVLATAAGTLLGAIPFVLLRRASGATAGQLGVSAAVVGHNWDLLVRECLPWALSYKVYYAHMGAAYRPWVAPLPIATVQIAGAAIVAAIVLFALVAARRASIPRTVRRLGFAGALTFPVAIGAFLVSVMVMDHFSMRYLAVLTLLLPFASAPAAYVLGRERFLALLAPHLAASALCGWLGYGPFVRGPAIVLDPSLRDDDALLDLLRARGVVHAEADYWASYRLTLLSAERVIVVPTNLREDRYPPYRRAFEAAPRFAYVFDPARSREDLGDAERALRVSGADVERTSAGAYTVFLVTRR